MSSTAVYLSGREILNILEFNGVLGANGEVQKVLDSQEIEKEDKVHDLIYTVLAKYVVQMLNAAMGEDLFPDIKALPQHKETYFRRKETHSQN